MIAMKTLREIIEENDNLSDLTESRKKDVKIHLNGKEVDFGSDMHVVDLKRTLAGLERVRDCYELGSGARLQFAHACQRLKKLIQNLSPQETQAQVQES